MDRAGQNTGAREAAFNVLNRVIAGDAYADIVLAEAVRGLSEADRRLATELVYGVLRNYIKIDWAIGLFSAIKPKKMEHNVLSALRIGAYQLLFLTRVPASSAVNESVKLIGRAGPKKAGFVNAVLRRLDRERGLIKYPEPEDGMLRHASVCYSHPEWLVKRWMDRWGADDALKLLEANQAPPGKTVRVNTLLASRESLMKTLEARGMKVREALWSPDCVDIVEGALDPKDPGYYIQDEASALVARLLVPCAPAGALNVLDACAAPGGKTTHLAMLMGDAGRLIALDRYAGRLKALKAALARLKIRCASVAVADSSAPLPFRGAGEGLFDAILLDAPCSGLGVLRRSPDIKLRITGEDIRDLSSRQKALLENLSGCLKAGGSIVYSVCTFEPEETDDVVCSFLKRHDGAFMLEDAGRYLPRGCAPLVDGRGFLRTFPHRHGTDGFFAARIRRKSSCGGQEGGF